jgi:hypothetical protein
MPDVHRLAVGGTCTALASVTGNCKRNLQQKASTAAAAAGANSLLQRSLMWGLGLPGSGCLPHRQMTCDPLDLLQLHSAAPRTTPLLSGTNCNMRGCAPVVAGLQRAQQGLHGGDARHQLCASSVVGNNPLPGCNDAARQLHALGQHDANLQTRGPAFGRLM